MARPPPLPELVRFCHPAKILGGARLPGTLDDDAVAGLYGTDPATYRALAAELAAEARRAAAGLPPVPRASILALGDSITDDLGSWAEILRHAGAAIVNEGLSGDTTAGARVRLTRALETRPRWAVVMLGTNDARRHGRDGEPILVSDGETRRNLRAIDAKLRRRCEPRRLGHAAADRRPGARTSRTSSGTCATSPPRPTSSASSTPARSTSGPAGPPSTSPPTACIRSPAGQTGAARARAPADASR